MPRQEKYAILHSHSSYSFLDGLSRPSEMPKYCLNNNISSVAITDHGVAASFVESTKVFKDTGVKLIYGFEAYLTNDRFSRDRTRPRHHLVLLAKNQEGLKNILALTSIGFTEGFYYKPCIDLEVLKQHSAGIICSQSCAGGPVAQRILKDDESGAIFEIEQLKSIFKDDFYLEMQPTREDWQIKINEAMAYLSKTTNTPVIITPDSHYIRQEDFEAHEIMLCVQTRGVITDPTGDEIAVGSSEDADEAGSRKKRFSFKVPDYFFHTPETIYQYFEQYHKNVPITVVDEALARTLEIEDKCNAEYELGQNLYPSYEVERNARLFEQYEKWQSNLSFGNLDSEIIHTPMYKLH